MRRKKSIIKGTLSPDTNTMHFISVSPISLSLSSWELPYFFLFSFLCFSLASMEPLLQHHYIRPKMPISHLKMILTLILPLILLPPSGSPTTEASHSASNPLAFTNSFSAFGSLPTLTELRYGGLPSLPLVSHKELLSPSLEMETSSSLMQTTNPYFGIPPSPKLPLQSFKILETYSFLTRPWELYYGRASRTSETLWW